ncbi:chemotaxis protein CheW [Fusobacterium sp. MFO224]|uniref:chemotaxis protein CheW n=1 Tax=Fusobacterium sp. MFO224 TaxID=3378070 RepID=UPI0038542DFF
MCKNKKIQILEFEINNNYYALKIEEVKEIVVDVEKQEIINSFNFINGIFKYRDEVYTALDMELIFRGESIYEKEVYLLTYNEKNINIALRLNKINLIREVDETQIEVPDLIESASDHLFVEGIVNLKEDHLIQIININKLIEFIESLKNITIKENGGEKNVEKCKN